MNSKYLFLIETLYMTNLGCHYTSICSIVLSQKFRAVITFLQPLIRICVNNGHTNFVARSHVAEKHYEISPLYLPGLPSVRPPLDFSEIFKCVDVTNICGQIL